MEIGQMGWYFSTSPPAVRLDRVTSKKCRLHLWGTVYVHLSFSRLAFFSLSFMHFHNKLNQAEENLNHRLKQNTSLQIFKLHLIFINNSIRSTLMQTWKSPSIFVFIWKQYFEGFTLKHLLLFEICARKICERFIYKHPETIEYVKN